MLDDLPPQACKNSNECAIINVNKTGAKGLHWVAYWISDGKEGKQLLDFDSFGQITPIEIQTYLKTKEEFRLKKNVIQRNTDIVQLIKSSICGQLCLYVLNA